MSQEAPFRFELQAHSGAARAGLLSTPRGPVPTPCFMPVGTRGSVKGISPRELREVGSRLVLANTYHLMLRPGEQLVAEHGGLPGFTGYPGPFLTDSGGFQVLSLGALRRIEERGVFFRSHLDGQPVLLTPERSVQVQQALGADLIMAFDECPPYPAEASYLRPSLERTLRWLERCLQVPPKPDQALFGIVQGGTDLELREVSLRETVAMGLAGYAIGGLAVGESKEEMYRTLAWTAPRLPGDRPRYLMGVGHPEDLVAASALGIDLFDCVYPTRTGRFGYALTDAGRLNLRSSACRSQLGPVDPSCDCETCRSFSRAYLAHLIHAGELLAPRAISLHNLRYLHRLMERVRSAIAQGALRAWAESWGEAYFGAAPPTWFCAAVRAA